MTKKQILDEILKRAIAFRDKKGKKLDAPGICYQLYYDNGVWEKTNLSIIDIIAVVKFFIKNENLYVEYPGGYLPKQGIWTAARRVLLKAIIKGLQDPKVRRQVSRQLLPKNALL
jgi:hypothetical protein